MRSGSRPTAGFGGSGGVVGAVGSVLGLSTGPCSVVGCGAPVLPAVGLVFAGLSSGTLALLSSVSRASTIVVVALVAATVFLGWQTGVAAEGARERPPRARPRPG